MFTQTDFSMLNSLRNSTRAEAEASPRSKQIQNIMGHSNIQTTLDVYTKISKAKEERNFDIITKAFSSAVSPTITFVPSTTPSVPPIQPAIIQQPFNPRPDNYFNGL